MTQQSATGQGSRLAFHDYLREARHLSDAAVRLAFKLDGYADKSRKCWPSQARLAHDLGWSTSKAKRYMAELQEQQVIVYEKRAHHRGEQSLMRLQTGVIPDTGVTSDTSSAAGTGVIRDHEPVSSVNGTGVRDDTRNSPKNSPRNPPTGGMVPTDIQHLWDVTVGRLPGKLQRRLNSEPASARQRLVAAIQKAEATGATPKQLRDLWDEPTSLDHDSVRSVSQTYAKRIWNAYT